MSVYNGAKFLAEAIDSILAQTFTDFEFIIINDASSDDSLHIINSYKDARIVLLQNTKNIGLTKSLNIGIAKAKGKYVARMDADDISMPKRLEKQFGFMEEHPEFAFCGTRAKTINDAGDQVNFFKEPLDSNKILGTLLLKNCFFHSSITIRRDALLTVSGYDEEFIYAQDYRLYLQLFESQLYGTNINESLLVFKVSSSGVSQTNSESQDNFACQAIQKVLKSSYSINVSVSLLKNIRTSIIYSEKLGVKQQIQSAYFFRKLYRNYHNKFFNNKLACETMRSLINQSLNNTVQQNTINMLMKRFVYFKSDFNN